MTCPSWVSHSFTEFYKPLHHNKAVIHEWESSAEGGHNSAHNKVRYTFRSSKQEGQWQAWLVQDLGQSQ